MSDLVINDDFGPLAELMEQAESSPDQESLQQCEALILERIRAEVAAKSDGLRRAIVWHEKLAEDAKRVAKQAEARATRIRAYVKAEMERAGVRRIDTATGSLLVRGNGGVEPLVVYEVSQIPRAMQEITVRMPLSVWDAIKPDLDVYITECQPGNPVPSNLRIREAIGAGMEVPGARLDPRGTSLVVK